MNYVNLGIILVDMPKDNFSNHASEYASFRPNYPSELIQFVVSQVGHRGRVLDVATGNGQVAVALAGHFESVNAIDLSQTQIDHAKVCSNIEYQVSVAEKTPFKDNTFDLITVGQALHWFRFDEFFVEMKRVAKTKAILAVWGYGKSHVADNIDAQFNHFHQVLLGEYWDPERDHIDAEYKDISMPIDRVAEPEFSIEVRWTREQYIKYIQTWSAVKHFQKAKSYDPTIDLENEFRSLWPDGEIRTVKFPIFIYLGILK